MKKVIQKVFRTNEIKEQRQKIKCPVLQFELK